MKTLRHKTEFHTWRQKINRLKENRTGGFTLVELIVVLVVLAILCSIGVMGIIGWQKHADFKKQNEYAKNLFVAAQTQLTQYAERGQLIDLIDEISDMGKADFSGYRLNAQGQLISSSGNVFHAGDDSLWQEYETEGKGANKGEIYYLKVKKGDYQKYLELKALSQAELKQRTLGERRIRILYDMLDPYIADKSMLDAAICLEFDPDPKVALVYSVFYNEKAKEFTYDSGENTGIVSIRDRREQSRKEDNTGYYGAEALSRGTDTYIARPVISNVRLNNNDSLSLTWSVNSEEALYGLIYKLNIFAAPDFGNADGKLAATILLGKADQPELKISSDGSVLGSYIVKNQAGEWEAARELEFPISIDRFNRTLTIILDGLDIDADESAPQESLNQSASIRRLGLNQVENLYVSISGTREGTYKLTAEKRSNTEHQFFGKLQKEDALSIQKYTIENARHLYNIRYYEQSNTLGRPVTYRLSSNIDWEAAGRAGQFYKSGKNLLPKAEEQVPHFKPILTFRPNSIFMSEDANRPYRIKNLKLDSIDVPVPEGQEASDTVGLIVKNQGRLQNLILENITVTGNQEGETGATGAFCGENSGSLINLTVDRGSIIGGSYVGGIVGKIEGSGIYQKLTNRAEVTGRLYVGGITGSVTGTTGNIEIRQCENYGKVRGKARDDKEPYYIGGISGYAQGQEDAQVTFYQCSGSPVYAEEEIRELTEQIKQGDTSGLTGTYVGGIVGFNQGATIDECNTLREATNTPGYVIGKEFVGGIVGFHSGSAGLNGGNNRNQANVIGENYVGGITGCNAGADLNPATHQLTIHKVKDQSVIISSWINEGGILATGNYAGGIAGCNYGTLADCNSSVNYTEDIKSLTDLSANTRYAGGIAGYNAGDIRNTDSTNIISAVSVIAGSDYVGGIAGYNDIGGIISGYELKGGYIQGKKFVGGFIGLNTSDKIFGNAITCNLNQVSGQYFVGGVIGANLMPTYQNRVETIFLTDNFLGNVTAEQGAFAGGFVGYNYLLAGNTSAEIIETAANELCGMTPVTDTDLLAASGQLLQKEALLQSCLAGFANTHGEMVIKGEANTFTQTKLGGIRAMVYVGGVVGYNQDSTKLQIQDVENITPVTATAYIEKQEDGIQGSKQFSYAGGMIGKVAGNVTLDNCHNRDVGEVKSMGTYNGGLAEINYGLIKNCTAGSLGSGEESYLGGLVGANVAKESGKGLVDCEVSGTIIGQSYVGGLTAENYGRIERPRVVDCTVIASGQHAGGVAAYGYEGSIIILADGSEIDISISGSAVNAGGIIGTNEGSIQGENITNTKTDITGHSNIGGFIGVQKKVATLKSLENNASVQAEEGYAGGIVARLTNKAKESMIEDCQNYGAVEVLAERSEPGDLEEEEDNQSAAGGITAINYGTITRCVNYGTVSASGGYSGGITGINYKTITRSRVNDSMKETLEVSGNLLVGGVAAKNEKSGIIEYTSVQNLILRNESDSQLGYMGGVSAENHGTIKNCVVGVEWYPENSTIINYENWQTEAALSVSKALTRPQNGKEYSYTLLSASGSLQENSAGVVLISNSADTSLGGVAGINTGTIEGYVAEDKYAVVMAELRFSGYSMNYYGYLGGIAGINQGTVSNYEFNGLIHGTANNPSNAPEFNPNYDFEVNKSTIYGYGGIVGLNGDDKQAVSDVKINDCKVNAARVHGIGDANNRANVGGVAGVNGVGAEISGIRFGNLAELKTIKDYVPVGYNANSVRYEGSVWIGTDYYGHSGGVAGYNQGEITDINQWDQYAVNRETYFNKGIYSPQGYADAEDTGVLIINTTGHAGGIVGFNRRTGFISKGVTGKNWLVFAPKQGEDNAVGGIIGYNISEQNLEYLDNHSAVIKTIGGSNSVGGIIGRNENATTSSWRLYECRNYGTISGNARAGGMVGHWKYKGGILEKCRNYGAVKANAELAGGMTALFYSMLSGETVNMIDCENHGNISAGSGDCGGMVGGITGGNDRLNLNLAGAINTGIISGNGNASGLVAATGWKSLTLSYCHNYGYRGNNNANFAGLSRRIPTKTVDCFGVTDQILVPNPVYPGTGAGTGGYYFRNPDTTAKPYGIQLSIRNNQGLEPNGNVKIKDMGSYGWEEVLLKEEGDKRRTDSKLAYGLYQDFDSYLWTQSGIATLAKPVIREGKNMDGSFLISWDDVPGAQYYTAVCSYLYQDGSGREVTVGSEQTYTSYSRELKLNTEYTVNGVTANKIKVKVRAHAVAGSGTQSVISSEYSEEKVYNLEVQLPVPQVHWELVELSKDECYRVVLDNKAEFEAFVAEQGGKIKLEDITIQTFAGQNYAPQSQFSFHAKDGQFASQKVGLGKDNRSAVSYAETDKAGYTQSAKVIRETRLPLKNQFAVSGNNGAMANVALEQTRITQNNNYKVGFSGTAVDTLSYQVRLQPRDGWGIYYRAELVAKDPVLGISVAYAVSAQNRLSPSNNEAIEITLSGFPTDFLEKKDGVYRYQDVLVRSYPTKTPNDIGYCGWQLKTTDGKQSWSWEELQELCVGDTGRIEGNRKLIDKTTVRPGYVVEYAGVDTYTVYYNTLLQTLENQYPQESNIAYTPFGETSTFMKNQVIYRSIDLNKEIKNTQPAAVAFASAQYAKDPDNAANMKWQNGLYDEADTFLLTWDQKEEGGKPAYTNSQGLPPYDAGAEYRLTITGELQDGRKTTLVNSKTIKTVEQDEKGRYNTYEADASRWDYKNIHVSLTRVGIVDNKGNTEKFPAVTELDFPMRRRLSLIGKPTAALKKSPSGVVMKDGLNYTISWSGISNAEELQALHCYEVVITGLTSGTKLTSQTSGNETSLDVNLETFSRGEAVTLFVRAIAKDDSTAYRDSMPGTDRSMTLPLRLLAPEMGASETGTDQMTASGKELLSVAEFEDGCMIVQMQPDGYESLRNFNYQIALQVFESEEAAGSPDGEPVEVIGLPQKTDEKPVYMGEIKDVDGLAYQVKGIPAKYAGYYLKVVLRVVSDSDISSVWTDEDQDIPQTENQEAHKKVTPYKVFRLPKVQVDSVSLSKENDVEIETYTKVNGTEDKSLPVTVTQEAVSFTAADYADDYHISIIQTPQAADKRAGAGWQVSEVSEIALKKTSETTYSMEYSSTEDAYYARPPLPLTEIEIGKEAVAIPYKKEIIVSADTTTIHSIDAVAYLSAERTVDDELVFHLILPDFNRIPNDKGETIIEGISYTEQILIQALAPKTMERFVDSKWAIMGRTGAVWGGADSFDNDREGKNPMPVGDVITKNLPRETAYEVNIEELEDSTRYLVSVKMGEAELGVFAVPFERAANIASKVTLPTWLGQYQNEEVTLTFRSIFDVGSNQKGGMSAWANTSHGVILPPLPVTSSVLLEQMTASAQTYEVGTEETGRKVAAQQLEARQTQVSWIYEVNRDSKVNGYDIRIGGAEKDDYHLQLDVSQDAFGIFRGLREYMEPEGKTLYWVSYDLDGNMLVASPSDAASPSEEKKDQTATPSYSEVSIATASNSQASPETDIPLLPGEVRLNCTLKAELVKEGEEVTGIRFTLVLPDVSIGCWAGDYEEKYLEAYPEGMYRTEAIMVTPWMVNSYYEEPEEEWFYLDKTLLEV